jgi:flagellar biogenesis protein FliO
LLQSPQIVTCMQLISICLLIAAILAISWVVYRIFYTRRKTKRLAEQKLQISQELIRKLDMGEKVMEADVLPLD